MDIQFKRIDFKNEEFEKIKRLRQEFVFNEEDCCDEKAIHIVCHIGELFIACGSLYGNNGEFKIANLVVKERYRNFKIGTDILNLLCEAALEQGAEKISGKIPFSSLKFAENNGFFKTGIPVFENGRKIIECEKNFIFKDAKWVAFGGEYNAVIAGKEFYIDNINKKTELFVSGLGFCDVYVNGKSVADRKLAPAWTNYKSMDTIHSNYPIFDVFTYRILYERLDITEFLKEGKNTIVFHIGGGWFSQRECLNEGLGPYGDIMLVFKILSDDKLVSVSDKNVKYKKSFITRSNIYHGEEQDLRIGGFDFSIFDIDDESLKESDEVKNPEAILTEQDCPEDRVIRTITPECIFERGSYKVYDLGENVSGYPVIKFSEKSHIGERCTIRFSEELNEDGSLDFRSIGGNNRAPVNTITAAKNHEECHTYFTWYGCRYFEVLGNVTVKCFNVVHTDLKQIKEFKSSNETLQWIVESYVRTQLNNVHCSVPSDCPHRERLGYTGDGWLASDSVMTMFDAEALYRKWIRDIADSQDIYSGHVTHTAPFYGGGGGPGGWGGAIVFVPYNFYKHYNDKALLEKYYPNMLMYLDYMENHTENGLVVSEEAGGWCLGDWCSPENRNLIPEPFVNTYFLIKAYKEVIEIAEVLGYESNSIAERLKNTTAAFIKAYYNENDGTFCNSLEASDAYALDIGLGDERTLNAVINKYSALGEFDTGIFGTDILIRVLCENNQKDLAKALLTSEKENTFYNMKKHGATTLWEMWNGQDSHSHPMFGAVVSSIIKYFNEV